MQVNVLLIVSDFPVFQLGGEKRWGKCFRLLEGLGRSLIGDLINNLVLLGGLWVYLLQVSAHDC